MSEAENASVFTARETQLFISIMKNMEGTIQFNKDAVATELGLKDGSVVTANWNRLLRNKINIKGTATDGSPVPKKKPTPKKGTAEKKETPKKRARKVKDKDDTEATPTAKKVKQIATKVKDEEVDAAEDAEDAEDAEGTADADDVKDE